MPAGIISAVSGIATAAGNVAAANQARQGFSAANQADIGLENQILGTTGQNLQPFVNEGQGAGSALGGLLGLPGYNAAQSQQAFKNYLGSTNYQFLLNQGEQGQAFLNAPNLQSGATEKALTGYAEGLAGNALQGYEGLLQNQQGLGVNAASSLGSISTNLAGLEQQSQLANAGAQAQLGVGAQLGLGNAINSAFSTNSSALGGALSSLFNPSASSYGANPSVAGIPSPFA